MKTLIHARRLLPGWAGAALLALLGGQLVACTKGSPDECVEAAVEVAACGLNSRGTQSSACVDGSWADPGPCANSDVCVDGDAQSSACGINGRGIEARSCVEGAWTEFGACADPDTCVDGDSRSLPCGSNGKGSEAQTCADGGWASSGCVPPETCNDGELWQEACGVLGVHSQPCVGTTWSDYGPCDDPPSLTIDAQDRRDMVHDAKRHRVYLTTGGDSGTGEVRVFDLVTRAFGAPLLTGGDFVGIDLSPDQNRLLVADAGGDADKNWVHAIDLTTGTSRKVQFDLDFYEGGTYSVAFTSNSQALVTSRFNGSGWVPLRRVDLPSGMSESISSVRQDTMLTPSADGSAVAYAESNSSGGEWGTYDIAMKTFVKSSANLFLYEIAVSRDASQFAMPTYFGLEVFDGAHQLQSTLGGSAVGAVYSPVTDELYVTWAGEGASVDVYSTATLQKVRDLDATPGLFGWIGNQGFGDGRLRISRDGAMLLVTRDDSLILYHTGP